MIHRLALILSCLLVFMLAACEKQPDVVEAPASPAKVPAAPAQMPPVDEVFGMFYARTLEYALRNHHPGGKFSLAHWDRKDHTLALPERFLNRVLSASEDFRTLYVPPERLQSPPKLDERVNDEPIRDSLDGEDVFLYSLSGMDWIAPATVRVEYKRFRVSGDFMWQSVTLKQEGDDWKVINEEKPLGDNYKKEEAAREGGVKVVPGRRRLRAVLPPKGEEKRDQ
jgi:hypothetical protein